MPNINVTMKDIKSILISEIEKYLVFNGWSIVGERRTVFDYIKNYKKYDESIILPLPKNNEIINYNESIFNLIKILSSVEQKTPLELINDIVEISNDIIRMKVISISDYNRSIPLDIAANEIDALKRLFIYSASSEDKPRPFFEIPTPIGINHGNYCQFGHTFEGSFGFTINSPLSIDTKQYTFEPEKIEKTFERKVVERIANGFISIKRAIESRNVDEIVNTFEIGMNSKMCDAIIDMTNKSSNIVNFSLNWSPMIKVSKKCDEVNKFKISPDTVEIVKDASAKLKTVEPFNDTIVGRIITLHSNKSPFTDEEFPRIAIVKHFYENRPIEVKLELTREQYKAAWSAHGNGATIKAIGKLYRRGNTWRMIEVKIFDILHA